MTILPGDPWPYNQFLQAVPFNYQPPNPKVLPVNVPFPDTGLTIVTMDSDGNVTIKTNQPHPE